MRVTPAEVLRFWYQEAGPKAWFKKSKRFDTSVRRRFGATVDAALRGALEPWQDEPESCRALIIVLDQLPRNIHRGEAEAFSGDAEALRLSQRCLDQGWTHAQPDESSRHFMLIPMMHSEDLDVQERSLPLFKQLTNERIYDYAVRHRDIVARFGRFPHRNAILGRQSTPEERHFLTQRGSRF